MPLPLPPLSVALARFFLVLGGQQVPFEPAGAATLTREPDATGFYSRVKLAGPLTATGEAYRLLRAQEQSPNRCQAIGLLVETRPDVGAAWGSEYAGTFSCDECAWEPGLGRVGITPTANDPYRGLLEAYDTEVNLLGTPSARRAVTASLATLDAGVLLQFRRIDATQEGDETGVNGWTAFLRNKSWVSGTGTGGTYDRTVLLFRYRRVGVTMIADPAAPGTFVPPNMSAGGWEAVLDSRNNGVSPPTIDYVKTPDLAGFRPYVIGHYNNWNNPANGASTPAYGAQLLLLPCFESPADYGYSNALYLKVTGAGGGASLGGAETADTPGCLNTRVRTGSDNPKSLWWRFGDFRFGQCFRLRDAVHHVLARTLAGAPNATPDPALLALLPPSPDLLGDFLTAATNPATGDAGPANEVPGLLLSAASDVTRFSASESATRVMITLKQLLADLAALYDCGWFIDPATGWFRLEHRAYLETQRTGGAVVDLRPRPALPETSGPGAQPARPAFVSILPAAYTYRRAELARYDELSIANAQTQEPLAFDRAEIDYGPGGCTTAREGQNRSRRSAARLTGDVAAGVLSGNAVPDSAVFVLAADGAGRLSDANRAVSAPRLLQRYHRRGRATGAATVGGTALAVQSQRPAREQAGISLPGTTLQPYGPTARLTTWLPDEGAIPNAVTAKATLDLRTATVTLAAWLPAPAGTGPAPVVAGRQFADSFSDSFK